MTDTSHPVTLPASESVPSAHTGGPWELREIAFEATPMNKRRVYRMEIVSPIYVNGRRVSSRLIAQIIDFCDWTDHPANARLIAAAPKLLAVCVQAENWFSHHGDEDDEGAMGLLAMFRAALASASGKAEAQ